MIAIDKTAEKVKKISQNAALLKLNCIKTFCYDSTKALATDKTECGQGNIFFFIFIGYLQKGTMASFVAVLKTILLILMDYFYAINSASFIKNV